MKIVLFINRQLGLDVLRYLQMRRPEVEIEDVVVPRDFSLPLQEVPASRVTRWEEGQERLAGGGCDLGVSILFPHILPKTTLDQFEHGVINLHPSYLPYGRGEYPSVWAIVEGTPAGVSLHLMDEGVDTGPLLQVWNEKLLMWERTNSTVKFDVTDTGESLHQKLLACAYGAFTDWWPGIESQVNHSGVLITCAAMAPSHYRRNHRRRDVRDIDHIDLEASYPAKVLIDRLRARTYPPHEACWFRDPKTGRKVYVRVSLEYADG